MEPETKQMPESLSAKITDEIMDLIYYDGGDRIAVKKKDGILEIDLGGYIRPALRNFVLMIVERNLPLQSDQPTLPPGPPELPPVPEGIYYNEHMAMFYSARNQYWKGLGFYEEWYPRRHEFPTSREEAIPATPPVVEAIGPVDDGGSFSPVTKNLMNKGFPDTVVTELTGGISVRLWLAGQALSDLTGLSPSLAADRALEFADALIAVARKGGVK